MHLDLYVIQQINKFNFKHGFMHYKPLLINICSFISSRSPWTSRKDWLDCRWGCSHRRCACADRIVSEIHCAFKGMPFFFFIWTPNVCNNLLFKNELVITLTSMLLLIFPQKSFCFVTANFYPHLKIYWSQKEKVWPY